MSDLGPPLSDGDHIGEIRDGYRWDGVKWVPISARTGVGAHSAKTQQEIDDENKRKTAYLLAAVIGLILLGLLIWWIASAVNDDDEDDVDANPTPSASDVLEENEIALNCPEPIGNVTVTTDPENQWAPGKVVDSNIVLHPVAFGEMTFTNTDSGEKFTEPAVTLTGADQTGAVTCTFTDTVEDDVDENGDTVNGTIEGTVVVVAR